MAELLSPLFGMAACFLLPTAPARPLPGGRTGPSWYDYDGDPQRFQRELERTERLLLDFLRAVEAQLALTPRVRFLLGYSQGGYCGAWVALRHPDRFRGMVISSARVKTEVLAEAIAAAGRLGFTALLCHGERDESVKPEAARTSRDGLAAGGVQVTLRMFDSGHALGSEQVEAIRVWLAAQLDRD